MTENPDDAPAQKKPAEAKKKKKSKLPLFIGTPVLLIGVLVYYGFKPLTGTMKYGICRVFVEQTLTYPTELKILSVEERPNDVRMEYASINEFGEYIVGVVTCVFREDPQTTYALADVVLNRQKIPQDRLVPFNATIPFILANPPSLNLPPPIPVELIDLQR